jgi:hypothetical protein
VPLKYDLRPLPGSPAVNRGVRVYVPWGLSAVTGEWHFRKHRGDPTRLIDDSMYLTRDPQASGDAPETRNDLRVEGATDAHYDPVPWKTGLTVH